MWIIALGCNGLVGLAAFVSMLTLPPALLLRKIKARNWDHPAVGGAAVLGVVVALYMCDSLFNAMMNPIFMLAAGGVASIASLRDPFVGLTRARPAVRPAAPPVAQVAAAT
jgi:O-antigen ligase